MRGTPEEIIDGMMATAKAWGSPFSRAEAARITDKAIRRRRWQIKSRRVRRALDRGFSYGNLLEHALES